MKKLHLLFIFLTLPIKIFADEGMWMPKQLPQIEAQLKSAGLKLNPSALTQLTEFPMGAVVSLGGCSASFVSNQGLVVTNHHCIYGSLGHNSKEGQDLIHDGFLANSLDKELPASPGSRVLVTKKVDDVTKQVMADDVKQLSGKQRFDAIEAKQKSIIAECETDEGHRCTVASFYGGLEYYLIKQLEIRDVRLVYAPPGGVGKFGGDTDNWMWPRQTGDFGFYRAYVAKDGKAADFSKDNVPYKPEHVLKIAKEELKEGDFVMVLGYPGRTNRHRLPSEISFTFDWSYPMVVKTYAEALKIIDNETKNSPDAKIKYASTVAGLNNYYKNRSGMVNSYLSSDILPRKTKEHSDLVTWVNSDASRRDKYGKAIVEVEQLLEKQSEISKRNFYLSWIQPRLLGAAKTLFRLANENQKPDTERKAGYQARDLKNIKAGLERIDRSYDAKVDKALVVWFMQKYLGQPETERNAEIDKALGLKNGMSADAILKVLNKIYAGTKLSSANERLKWLEDKPDSFKKSQDSMIQLAVALYESDLKFEEEYEELSGKIQAAYSDYMQAKLDYMKSLNRAVYPDANSTLRVTFGNIAGRVPGADGSNWTAFTTVDGVTAKATGEGDFDAPSKQLDAIRSKDFGKYVDSTLKTVPVNFLATLDITGGNSGSAVLNAQGEFVGLCFDGTLDSIISDWDFNTKKTRSIQVDYRYMLWQMQHVDKADNLLKEMGII